MLCNLKEAARIAIAENSGLPAFNVFGYEDAAAVINAAERMNRPVVLMTNKVAVAHMGIPVLAGMLLEMARRSEVPTCVHLDHATELADIRQAVDSGYTSVMIDGSHHSFEENIAVTKRVVEYAHDHGVWVEAELGRLAGVEEDVSSEHSIYTDPDQAVEFVRRSGCDSLAIAIGTSHGAYKFKGEAKLDFDRLETIGKLLPGYPLVLHGASSVPKQFVDMCNAYGGKVAGAAGVPEELLRKAAGMAICKINIDTDIRLAMTASIRKHLVEHPEEFDPRGYLKPARQAVKDMVQHKIKNVLGCSGKA